MLGDMDRVIGTPAGTFTAVAVGRNHSVAIAQNGNGKISGNIVFSALSGSAPVVRTATVKVLDWVNGSVLDSQVVTTAPNGDYSLFSTARGNVRIQIDADHFLKKYATYHVFLNDPITGINAALINGDINDDNFIGFDDYDILTAAFNLSEGDPGFVIGADLNEDLFVGFDDFDILSANFNTSGNN